MVKEYYNKNVSYYETNTVYIQHVPVRGDANRKTPHKGGSALTNL